MQNNFFHKFLNLINNIFWYLTVLTGLFVTILPIIWIFVSSFRPHSAIFKYATSPSVKTFIPTPFTIDPYITMFQHGFGWALANSLIVSTAIVSGGLIVNSMAGFVFAKIDFPGRTLLFILTIVTFMLPFRAIAIPLFTLIKQLGWRNSYQALIVPGLFNGMVILLYRQFFKGVPDEFVDSARIDGASWWQIYWKIFLPISKTAAISGGLLLFIGFWLSFLWPLLVNPDPRYQVAQVAIAKFSTEHGALWNQQFGASIITTLIPVILILNLQKYFVGGISGTEIKQ